MLKRFIKLRTCVCDAPYTSKSKISVSDAEFMEIEQLFKTLKPLKYATEALCCADSNLIKADAIFSTLIESIDVSTDFGKALKDQFLIEILNRRTDYSSVLQYLHNKNENVLCKEFKPLSKSLLIKKIHELSNLFQKNIGEVNNDEEEDKEVLNDLSFVDQMNERIKKHSKPIESFKPSSDATSTKKMLKDELDYFERTGIRGPTLELIYNALMLILPTSVESERAFSTAGWIKNKVRSTMGDNFLNFLTILNKFFRQKGLY